MISFLLNDQLHQITDLDPNTTILRYVREHLNKTGTKEGCASGDCGACTVVVGELADNSYIRYRTVNACISLVATLQGKQLILVEDLKKNGELHPSQKAMVDCHGSQCGFCTPGFVMSLFALKKNNNSPDRHEIEEALAGNLCRCTGYRPIVDAAVKMYEATEQDDFSLNERVVVEKLRAIQESESVSLSSEDKKYFAPKKLSELADLLIRFPDARLLSGGSDLNLEITQLLNSFETIIYLGNVDELAAIKDLESHYLIGAAVKYSDCYEIINREYPDFSKVILRLGSTQIRNVGTLGGNIANASPIADTPPALIALGAKLHLQRGNKTRILALENFYRDYKKTALTEAELITAIELPKANSDYHFKMYKVSKRFDDDISAVCGAFYLSLDAERIADVHIVFGGMAATPKRATHCEAFLQGKKFDLVTVEQAARQLEKDFTPIDDVRASAEYRINVAKNLLYKCHLELLAPEEDLRVIDNA